MITFSLGGRTFIREILTAPAAGKDHETYLFKENFIGIVSASIAPNFPPSPKLLKFADSVLETIASIESESLVDTLQQSTSLLNTPNSSRFSLAIAKNNSLFSIGVMGSCSAIIGNYKESTPKLLFDSRVPLDDDIANELLPIYNNDTSDYKTIMAKVRQETGFKKEQSSINKSYYLEPNSFLYPSQIIFDTLDIADLEYLLLFSDGFRRLIKPFGVFNSVDELLKASLEQGLAPLSALLRKLENEDKFCSSYPRLGRCDDITAILIKAIG